GSVVRPPRAARCAPAHAAASDATTAARAAAGARTTTPAPCATATGHSARARTGRTHRHATTRRRNRTAPRVDRRAHRPAPLPWSRAWTSRGIEQTPQLAARIVGAHERLADQERLDAALAQARHVFRRADAR